MTCEFLPRLDPGMLEYFRQIVDVLVERLGISRAEAVARVNQAFGSLEVDPYPDLLCHELPEHWAYGLYYEDSMIPYWDPGADSASWTVREAPPVGTRYWTLAEE